MRCGDRRRAMVISCPLETSSARSTSRRSRWATRTACCGSTTSTTPTSTSSVRVIENHECSQPRPTSSSPQLIGDERHSAARVGARMRRDARVRHRCVRDRSSRPRCTLRTGREATVELPGGELDDPVGRGRPRLHDRPGRARSSRVRCTSPRTTTSTSSAGRVASRRSVAPSPRVLRPRSVTGPQRRAPDANARMARGPQGRSASRHRRRGETPGEDRQAHRQPAAVPVRRDRPQEGGIKQAQGIDVISLGIGDPDTPTPAAHRRRDGRGDHEPEEPSVPELRRRPAATARPAPSG